MAKTEKRIETVDMLRGFAALAVCWFHLTDTNAIAGSGVLEKSGRYGWLGVEIFFVISGFIIPYALHRSSYTLRHFGRFLLKRITRLDPPYIVSIVIAIILLIDFAKSFGKDGAYAIGLILLPFIFFPILAFGDAQYQGPAAAT